MKKTATLPEIHQQQATMLVVIDSRVDEVSNAQLFVNSKQG